MDHNEQGVEYFEAGEYKKALASFSLAFRAEPVNPLFCFNIARTLEELGDSQAENFFYMAIANGSYDALYELGILYTEEKESEDRKRTGLAFLRKFLEFSPEDEYAEYAREIVEKNKPPAIHLVKPKNLPKK